MDAPDIETVQMLRSDLALQITRYVDRLGQSQTNTAKQLSIPQPTLSKIVNGQIAALSLELLIRIAVRARLPLVLQTGTVPAEAGAYVSGSAKPERSLRSRVADRARDELTLSVRKLTPEQRLDAQLRHSKLVTALHHAGRDHAASKSARAGRLAR